MMGHAEHAPTAFLTVVGHRGLNTFADVAFAEKDLRAFEFLWGGHLERDFGAFYLSGDLGDMFGAHVD